MSIFKYLRTYVTKQDCLIRQNINKIGNKNKMFFHNLKIFTVFRNQNINNICSYKINLTRNAENCLFKMLENKSSIFSNVTDKMWKPRF